MQHRITVFLFTLLGSLLLNCTVTSLEPQKEERGKPVAWTSALQSLAGKGTTVTFRKVIAADWAVPREGLINIDHPKAKAASLKKGPEDIQIYFYVIEHPTAGRFIVDTGVAQVFRRPQAEWPIGRIIRAAMTMDNLKVHKSTAEWLKSETGVLSGVLVTHMHLDHIMGTPDIPSTVPFYVGPGESTTKHWQNTVVQGSTDRLMGPKRNLRELVFPKEGSESSKGLQTLDFFGDGSLFVFYSPGHTPGSLAFAARTTSGVELMLGDTCHTRWGWQNNVTPGEFTMNQERNARSLDALQELAKSVQGIRVHPGHQSM